MLYSLHFLRFIAAVAVAAHHSLSAFSKPYTSVMVGAAGVDVFFFISGMVIGMSDREEGALTFLYKRLVRVFPLYLLATLVYGLFRWHYYSETITISEIIHSVLLLPDFSRPNYVPIYYPAWTLSFEMLFYLSYACMLSVFRPNTNLAVALVMICVSALNIPVPFVPGAFFTTDLCAEFVGGVLVAEAYSRGFRFSGPIHLLALVLGLAGFVINSGTPITRAIYWGIPAVLLGIGFLGLERYRFLRAPFPVLAGGASYAIYLFQLPTMEFIIIHTAWWPQFSDPHYLLLREGALIGATIVVGVLIHVYIERPMTRVLRNATLLAALRLAPGRPVVPRPALKRPAN